jgi:hypothetical protein
VYITIDRVWPAPLRVVLVGERDVVVELMLKAADIDTKVSEDTKRKVKNILDEDEGPYSPTYSPDRNSPIPIQTNTQPIPIQTNTQPAPIQTNPQPAPIPTNPQPAPIPTNPPPSPPPLPPRTHRVTKVTTYTVKGVQGLPYSTLEWDEAKPYVKRSRIEWEGELIVEAHGNRYIEQFLGRADKQKENADLPEVLRLLPNLIKKAHDETVWAHKFPKGRHVCNEDRL